MIMQSVSSKDRKYILLFSYIFRTTEKSIPLSMITNSHMIDCENQLDSLILSCARYSLKPGLGTQITYDYKGIERGIVDRFIRSKLTIDNEKIYSAARQDVIVNIFKKVKEKIPQVINRCPVPTI